MNIIDKIMTFFATILILLILLTRLTGCSSANGEQPTEYLVVSAIGQHTEYGDGEFCVVAVTDGFYAVECDDPDYVKDDKVVVEFMFEVLGDGFYKLTEAYIIEDNLYKWQECEQIRETKGGM